MSDLFAWWWTSGHPEGPGADLALQSPISAQARRAFDAGRAAERQRIAEGLRVAARHMGYSGEEVLTAAWPHLAESLVDLLDGDGDA